MMVDIRYITYMSKYHQNPLSPYIDDFSAVNHPYLFRYAILGPILVQKWGILGQIRI